MDIGTDVWDAVCRAVESIHGKVLSERSFEEPHPNVSTGRPGQVSRVNSDKQKDPFLASSLVSP